MSINPTKISSASALLALALVAIHAATAFADWPQLQGPNRNGATEGQNLALEWPDDGPRTLWRVALGEGFAGPAIRDGNVYILDRFDGSQDILRCLDLETGAEVWSYSYDAPGRTSHDGSRMTPTVTDSHVYAVGLTGQFYCVDRNDGSLVWRRDLPNDFPVRGNLRWGMVQSPSIYKNLVIVAPQSKDAFITAFDKSTGDLVWASANLGKPGYSTPLVTSLCGVDQVVMISAGGSGGVYGLSIDNGDVLWEYDGWKCKIPIPFATPLPGNRLFITGEYGAGSAMIQIEEQEGRFSVDELFTTDEVGSQIHQPIFHQGYLYANSNGNSRSDGMLCFSVNGRLQWRTRDTKGLPRFERGGLLMADGLIVNFDGRRGTLHLIEPSPAGYEEIARAQVLNGARMWAPMALSEGKLVLRSQEEMICLDLSNP